jgi:hypothetical protein
LSLKATFCLQRNYRFSSSSTSLNALIASSRSLKIADANASGFAKLSISVRESYQA